MSVEIPSLKDDLSRLTRVPLTDKHINVIIENAERNGISNEQSACDFVNAMLDYERSRLPEIRRDYSN